MIILPISDIRRHIKKIVDQLKNNDEIIITRHGRPIAVLVPYQQWQREQNE